MLLVATRGRGAVSQQERPKQCLTGTLLHCAATSGGSRNVFLGSGKSVGWISVGVLGAGSDNQGGLAEMFHRRDHLSGNGVHGLTIVLPTIWDVGLVLVLLVQWLLLLFWW